MKRSLGRVIGVALLAGAALAPGAAQADGLLGAVTNTVNSVVAPCSGDMSQVFRRFGDLANYQLVPGGSFENGTSWTVVGGAVVPGNEPFFLTGAFDRSSLSLPAGVRATSPLFCVSAATPTMRFVARGNSRAAVLRVELLTPNPLNPSQMSVSTVYRVAGSGNWTTSPVVLLVANATGLLSDGLKTDARLRFVAESGTWLVDDVYLDPFKKV
jgi:hypothetical protein